MFLGKIYSSVKRFKDSKFFSLFAICQTILDVLIVDRFILSHFEGTMICKTRIKINLLRVSRVKPHLEQIRL